MTDLIKTNTVGKNFAQTSFVVLEETPTTMLCFLPEISEKGVRGSIQRYKKDGTEKLIKMEEVDFRKIKSGEGVHIELRTDALKKLIEEVKKREQICEQGIQGGLTEYVVGPKENTIVVTDENKREIIEKILLGGYTEDFWKLVSESIPELADKLSIGNLQIKRKRIVAELQERLTKSYSETAGDNSWQRWIYKHNWLFGVNYQNPIEKQKINISGVMPDYLFPTLDNFVDILEIKLPNEDVIIEDTGHTGSWVWSNASNYAIGQVVNYLNEIDRLRFEIERKISEIYGFNFSLLKPRAFILIGESDGWSLQKKEGLRKLNDALHGIEIITYTDLVNRGLAFTDSIENFIIPENEDKPSIEDEMPF